MANQLAPCLEITTMWMEASHLEKRQLETVGPDPYVPAPAGSADILVQLKRFLGLMPRDNVASVEIGFDHFQLRADSPLRQEHELINMLLPEVIERGGYPDPALSQ